jgi:hypothetical protein
MYMATCAGAGAQSASVVAACNTYLQVASALVPQGGSLPAACK